MRRSSAPFVVIPDARPSNKDETVPARVASVRPRAHDAVPSVSSVSSFDAGFAALFARHFDRLTRVLTRISGEPDLAADVVQDAFVRLHQRGSLPDAPAAWLVSVALNLFRNVRTTQRRRARLLTPSRAEATYSDPYPAPDERLSSEESRRCVRRAIDQLPERDRQLLLLRAEGYSYRELADAIGLQEDSVGTLLARAKARFRQLLLEGPDASR